MPTDRQLINAILQHQMYLDQLTRYQTIRFTKSVNELAKEVRVILNDIEKITTRELTFGEVRKVVRKIVEANIRVYNQYLEEFTDFLDEFTEEEHMFFAVLFGSDKVKSTLLENAIKTAPMAATGMLLLPFLHALRENTADALRRQILMGYGSNLSLRELLQRIVGTKSKNYRDGLLNRVFNWQKATIDTAIQHTSSTTNYEIARREYERYRWVSILDSVTCDVCYGRNDEVYYYEQGPVPPEHPNCRCDIIPIIEDENADKDLVRSFDDWMKAQDKDFKDDVTNSEATLTFSQYKEKLQDILKKHGD